MKNQIELRIGYIPLAHDVYWEYFPEHLEPALKLADEYEKYLSQYGKIVKTGKLIDCPERSKEARILFQKENIDVIILVTVTYSTPDDIALDLQDFPRPTIIWNTQKTAHVTEQMDFNIWMFEHGITGVPGLTNILFRCNIPYFLISGTADMTSVGDSFRVTMNAVKARKKIWGSKIGVFGHLYPGMIDFGYDPTQMYSKFGASTEPVLLTEVLKEFHSVPESDVQNLQLSMAERYTIQQGFEGEELTNSMRLALAMRKIVEDKNLDAVSVFCQPMWQDEQIGVVSCIGNSILAGNGIFTTCEGDVPTALTGMILSVFTERTFFSEIWCNDFESDQFVMGHSGQMNMNVFDGQCTKDLCIAQHPWWNGCKGHGACFDLTVPTGEITIASIGAAPDGNWHLVCTLAEIVNRKPTKLGAPHFFVKMKENIGSFIEKWGVAGAAHHVAVAYGDKRPELQAYAKIMKIDYISI